MSAQANESQSSIGSGLFTQYVGVPPDQADYLIVWGHGWGHTHHVFAPFAETLKARSGHLLLDFAGFGASPKPPDNWTTLDYANSVAALIRPYRHIKKIIWVGHSFGARVGIQLAAHFPDLVDGLFLFAAAGLRRKLSPKKWLNNRIKVYSFKLSKFIAQLLNQDIDALRSKFGSADYKAAGVMRPIFLTVVKEDLSPEALKIQCPTCLVYGADDRDTPPALGRRLAKMIAKSDLYILPYQDHLSVLTQGRPLVLKKLVDFMEKI